MIVKLPIRSLVYVVERLTLGVVQWVYVFARESIFCANVYLFLGEYLQAPLGDQVCCLIVKMSMVLYFQHVVGRVYGFAWCHVCVFWCVFSWLLYMCHGS